MAVSWTQWTPANLRQCWTTNSGTDLKDSCTTPAYSGGAPSSVTDLKPSIANHATGFLKQGLTTAADNDLKPSVKPAELAYTLTVAAGTGTSDGYFGYSRSFAGGYGAVAPSTFEGLDIDTIVYGTNDGRLYFGTNDQVGTATVIRCTLSEGGIVTDHTWNGTYYASGSDAGRAFLSTKVGQSTPMQLVIVS